MGRWIIACLSQTIGLFHYASLVNLMPLPMLTSMVPFKLHAFLVSCMTLIENAIVITYTCFVCYNRWFTYWSKNIQELLPAS